MSSQPHTLELSNLIKIDRAACIKCGACVRDCAFKALHLDDDRYPVLASEDRCMHCQHCFAICPNGAITFDGHLASEATPVKELEIPSPIHVENWLKSRRSIRRYKNTDVDSNVLKRILSALGNVPTGCNARGLTFTCIATRSAMDDFRSRFVSALEEHHDGLKLLPRWLAIPAIMLRKGGEDIFFRGAPGMLIVSSDEENPGVKTPKEDIIIALSMFELLAESNGLGTCWCGFLNHAQEVVPELMEKTLGFRQKTPFYAMLFGIPSVSYVRAVMRESDAKIDWRA